jgi:hypothetical protein
MAKGTVVAKKAVTRKKGYLYFVDADGSVRETKMNRKGGKKGRKVCAPKAAKKAAPKKRKTVKKAAPKKRAVAKKAAPRKRKTGTKKSAGTQLRLLNKY